MRLGNLRVSRIRRLLRGAALPRSPRSLSLFLHCRVEASPIHFNAGIMCNVFDEIALKAICVRKLKGVLSVNNASNCESVFPIKFMRTLSDVVILLFRRASAPVTNDLVGWRVYAVD